MSKVLVIYASDYGGTEKMAQAVVKGAESVENTTVVLKKAEEVTAADFEASDGVIIGTPVHMGSMDWRVKKMIDTECAGLWMKDAMNGKVAGVFASGSGFGSAGGGVELTMLSLLNNFAELGMVAVPLPKNTESYNKGGLQWGPYGRSADENMNHSGISDDVLELSKRHGKHIAKAAALFKANPIFG